MSQYIEHEHSQLVIELAKPGNEISRDLTPDQAHLLHMVVGVSGEAGELLDAIKKHVIYQKPLDVDNVIEELGDIEFYLEGIREEMGIPRHETLRRNIAKLRKRYGQNYSNAAAQARADKQETVDPLAR